MAAFMRCPPSAATARRPQTAANSRGVCVSAQAAAPWLTEERLPSHRGPDGEHNGALFPPGAGDGAAMAPPAPAGGRGGRTPRDPRPVRTLPAALQEAAEADGGGAQQLVLQRVAAPHLQVQVALSRDVPARAERGAITVASALRRAQGVGSIRPSKAGGKARGQWETPPSPLTSPAALPASVPGSVLICGARSSDGPVGFSGSTGPAPS